MLNSVITIKELRAKAIEVNPAYSIKSCGGGKLALFKEVAPQTSDIVVFGKTKTELLFMLHNALKKKEASDED